MLLTDEGCCGVGGASQDSAGFGAMEEGLISREGRNLRLPLRFGLRPQGPCRVGTGESGIILSEEGNSLPLEVLRGSQAPCSAVCGTCGCFRTMHDCDSAPSCCAITHWVAFEEVYGPRVLFKSGQGNRGLSACGTTHGASLKFPSETGFILRCAWKAKDPS